MSEKPVSTLDAWEIYANALNLLTLMFWVGLAAGVLATIATVAVTQDLAAAIGVGSLVAPVAAVITLGARGERVGKWVKGQRLVDQH